MAADRDSVAISWFLLSNRRRQFLLFRKISTNVTVKFGNRCYFKDMNFYGYGFIRTVPYSCFKVSSVVVRIINCMIIFFLQFSISLKLLYSFEEKHFWIFRKLQSGNLVMGSIFWCTTGFKSWGDFGRIFWNSQNFKIARGASVNYYFWDF